MYTKIYQARGVGMHIVSESEASGVLCKDWVEHATRYRSSTTTSIMKPSDEKLIGGDCNCNKLKVSAKASYNWPREYEDWQHDWSDLPAGHGRTLIRKLWHFSRRWRFTFNWPNDGRYTADDCEYTRLRLTLQSTLIVVRCKHISRVIDVTLRWPA